MRRIRDVWRNFAMVEATAPHVLAVAVETPQHAGLAACLDYCSEQPLAPGTLVRVPLGKRDVPGIVWQPGGAGAAAGVELRPIRQALTALPPLSEAAPWSISRKSGFVR